MTAGLIGARLTELSDGLTTLVDPLTTLVDPLTTLVDPLTTLVDPLTTPVDPLTTLVDPLTDPCRRCCALAAADTVVAGGLHMAERKTKTGGSRVPRDVGAALRSELEAVPAGEIKRPNRDVPAYITWAQALEAAVGPHKAALLATPMDPDDDLTEGEIGRFSGALALLTTLQDEHTRRQVGTSNLTPKQKTLYDEARAAEGDVVAVIRFAFRKDARKRAWCREVLRGDGLADLHDDVRALEAFCEENKASLVRFSKLGAARKRMTKAAAALPKVSAPDAEANKLHTRLRNAAWTQVDAIAARLCTAGRFALREDAAEARRFRRPGRAVGKKKAKAKGKTEGTDDKKGTA